MRGRKPDPTRLKMLKGNPGKRPPLKNEPRPPAVRKRDRVPLGLSDRARGIWRKQAPLLRGAGLLTTVDRPALAMLCEALGEAEYAQEQLSRAYLILGSRGNPMPSPWWRIREAAQMRALRLMVEFGMTPSARARTEAAEEEPGGAQEEAAHARYGL